MIGRHHSALFDFLHTNLSRLNRIAKGDKNIFLIDATGWITWDDVFPDSLHPTGPAQFKIADNVQAFLESWGLPPPSN